MKLFTEIRESDILIEDTILYKYRGKRIRGLENACARKFTAGEGILLF